MPVNARRVVRKMRGGSQPQLIEADDGNFYIVKFRNNPQHRRILINEWLAAAFLNFLHLATPAHTVVRIDAEFLEANPDLCIQLGTRRDAVQAGWHFGSRYPGHPDRVAVYDFVPDALLDKIGNVADFLGILAFDKWMGNADARQSIFIRARLREYAPAYSDHPLRVGFIALMIDHGYAFNGPHWEFTDAPVAGLYFRPRVYAGLQSWDDLEPWLARILAFPEEVVDDALRQMPADWLNGDRDALMRLLEKLLTRRKSVSELIDKTARERREFFPNWRGGIKSL
jgi:hypothetical protein